MSAVNPGRAKGKRDFLCVLVDGIDERAVQRGIRTATWVEILAVNTRTQAAGSDHVVHARLADWTCRSRLAQGRPRAVARQSAPADDECQALTCARTMRVTTPAGLAGGHCMWYAPPVVHEMCMYPPNVTPLHRATTRIGPLLSHSVCALNESLPWTRALKHSFICWFTENKTNVAVSPFQRAAGPAQAHYLVFFVAQ